jgi:hypothetical protein
MTLMDKACYERGCICYDSQDQNEFVEVVTKAALEEALAKQGEPVAWYVDFGNDDEPNYASLGEKPHEPTATIRPLIFGDTTPQQRTWVGLTDEQMRKICGSHATMREAVREAESILKESNT